MSSDYPHSRLLAAMRGMVLLAVATILMACYSEATTQPTPSPSIQIVYGPAPTNCPESPQPANVSPFATPVLGRAPLWATGFASVKPAPVPTQKFPPGPKGVAFKVLWLMLKDAGEPVSVHIAITDISSGALAWITASGTEGTEVVFDPAKSEVVEPAPGSNQAIVMGYPSSVAITHPGCFEIHASWVSGDWRSIFAAGTTGRPPAA